MPINSNIALQLQVPDIAGAIQGGMQFHDQRQQKKQLSDLLPRAVNGDTSALEQIWAIDPSLGMKLDERQRALASELTDDLSSAVRWADTPEKWGYVQQHYGTKGLDLSPYRFEDRERGLMTLGKLSGYLKGEPKEQTSGLQRDYDFIASKDPNLADQYLRNRAEGPPLILDNGDGTKTIMPRSGARGSGQPKAPPEGAIEMLRSNPGLAPQFDEKYGPGAAQRVLGGQTATPSDPFPGSGY